MSDLIDLAREYAAALQHQANEQSRIDVLRRHQASLEDRTFALLEELTEVQTQLRDTDYSLTTAHKDKALADVRAAVLAEHIDRVKDIKLGTTAEVFADTATDTDTDN